MELIEGYETSAISFVTPGNYPKENILHTGQGESLKSSIPGLFRLRGCWSAHLFFGLPKFYLF